MVSKAIVYTKKMGQKRDDELVTSHKQYQLMSKSFFDIDLSHFVVIMYLLTVPPFWFIAK